MKPTKINIVDLTRHRVHRAGLKFLLFCYLIGGPDGGEISEGDGTSPDPGQRKFCQSPAVRFVDGKVIWLQPRPK